RDVTVIRNEACISQHKLMVCVLDLKESVSSKRKVFVSRCKVRRLKDVNLQQSFHDKFKVKALERSCEDSLETMWKGLRDGLLKVPDEVCERTKGLARHKETWL